jgi:hypothetical protein
MISPQRPSSILFLNFFYLTRVALFSGMANGDLLGGTILWFSFQILWMGTAGFTLAHGVYLLSKFLSNSFSKDE